MKLNAVKVLNLLGSMDYRVIGTSSPDEKQVIWTLEHKAFEKLQQMQNNDIDHASVLANCAMVSFSYDVSSLKCDRTGLTR